MKKIKISVCSSLFLLLGCTEVENSQNPFPVHFSNENLKDICCIGAGEIEFSENQSINIRSAIEEIKKENDLKFYYDFIEDAWECSRQDKKEKFSETHIKCKYLGKWRGQDLIFRYKFGNFTGRFTDILLCTVKNGNFSVKKYLFLGDRAVDGIVSTPIFDGKNSIYFYCSLSTDAVAKFKGIKDEYPFQAAQSYWNVSKCVYNLETDKLDVIEMTITSKEKCPFSEILQKSSS